LAIRGIFHMGRIIAATNAISTSIFTGLLCLMGQIKNADMCNNGGCV
jgi:hypothetical protein